MFSLSSEQLRNIRDLRNKENQEIAERFLMGEDCGKTINVNKKALKRVLKDYHERGYINEPNVKSLRESHKGNKLAIAGLAKSIAIQASRQGSKDETLILTGIQKEFEKEKYNEKVKFIPLPVHGPGALRPIKKDGSLKEDDGKKEGCLKTLDARFSIVKEDGTLVVGYVNAKIVIGEGGHQDNVSVEEETYIEWAKARIDSEKEPNAVYVVLRDEVDTKKNYLTTSTEYPNIWICNHVELQEKIISELK